MMTGSPILPSPRLLAQLAPNCFAPEHLKIAVYKSLLPGVYKYARRSHAVCAQAHSSACIDRPLRRPADPLRRPSVKNACRLD